MQLLHLTDTHLGLRRWVPGAPTSWSRSDDHLAAFRAALEPALRGEVDGVVHSGDVFHRSRPPARAVHEAMNTLAEVARRVPVLLIAGNHDRRGIQRHLPIPVPNLHVVDRPTQVRMAGIRIAAVPYCRTADGWAGAAARAWGGGADLMVAHQAFHGVRVPGLVFREGAQADTIGERHVPAGVGHILCGHLHPRQVVTIGRATVVCPGSTERTAFQEREETKGYARWALERSVSWRFVDLVSRPMVVVEQEHHLAEVVPGSMVKVAAGAPRAWLEAIAALGGWALPAGERRARSAPPPEPQATLFAPRRR